MVREMGRIPAERTTKYTIIKKFDQGKEEAHPLDIVDYSEQKFGSYRNLIELDTFRFKELTGHTKRMSSKG
jgi:FO synthase subunit 2